MKSHKEHGSRPNLDFTTMDSEEPWNLEKKFDFIHNQGSSNLADHESVLKSTFQNLNPGGWAEFQYVQSADVCLVDLPLTTSHSHFVIQIGSTQGLTKERGGAMQEWNELVEQGQWWSRDLPGCLPRAMG